MNIRVKRVLAVIIDFYFICAFSSFLVAAVTLGSMEVSLLTVSIYLMSICLLTVVKDLNYKYASIGKRLLKIKVCKVNGTKFSFVDAVKRSLPMVLLPLEVFFLIIRNERLGDIWAETAVVDR